MYPTVPKPVMDDVKFVCIIPVDKYIFPKPFTVDVNCVEEIAFKL